MKKEFITALISDKSINNLQNIIGCSTYNLNIYLGVNNKISKIVYPDDEEFISDDIPYLDDFSTSALDIYLSETKLLRCSTYWWDTKLTYIDVWDIECEMILQEHIDVKNKSCVPVFVNDEFKLNKISKIEIYSYIEEFNEDIEKAISDKAIRFISENGNSFLLGTNMGISGTSNLWFTQQSQDWYLTKTKSFLRLSITKNNVDEIYRLDRFYEK